MQTDTIYYHQIQVDCPDDWRIFSSVAYRGLFLTYWFRRDHEVAEVLFHTDPSDEAILQVSHGVRETRIVVDGQELPYSVSANVANRALVALVEGQSGHEVRVTNHPESC